MPAATETMARMITMIAILPFPSFLDEEELEPPRSLNRLMTFSKAVGVYLNACEML